MVSKARIGLLIGIIGLVLNGLISGFSGITGTIIAILAAVLSGFIVARLKMASSKKEGARAGALAGGVSGCIVILGQIIGGMVAVFSLYSSDNLIAQLFTGLVGIGVALFFGALITLFAASTGALVGYIFTSRQISTDTSS